MSEIRLIKKFASEKEMRNIKWPMLVLRTPKGGNFNVDDENHGR